jgi:hypothetical protein
MLVGATSTEIGDQVNNGIHAIDGSLNGRFVANITPDDSAIAFLLLMLGGTGENPHIFTLTGK